MKIIYSNHALERIRQRHLNQDEILQTVADPDKKYSGEKPGHTKFLKKIRGRRYQVIAKILPDQDAWLIVSAWVRGEEDPESLLWTLIAAPFRFLGEVIKFFWKKLRSRKS